MSKKIVVLRWIFSMFSYVLHLSTRSPSWVQAKNMSTLSLNAFLHFQESWHAIFWYFERNQHFIYTKVTEFKWYLQTNHRIIEMRLDSINVGISVMWCSNFSKKVVSLLKRTSILISHLLLGYFTVTKKEFPYGVARSRHRAPLQVVDRGTHPRYGMAPGKWSTRGGPKLAPRESGK